MTAQPILGIDPGAHGAIAVLSEGGDLIALYDMPRTQEANGRTATNAPLLAGLLARAHARVAYCEFTGARSTDARTAAFAFGRARGVIEGCAGAPEEFGLRRPPSDCAGPSKVLVLEAGRDVGNPLPHRRRQENDRQTKRRACASAKW